MLNFLDILSGYDVSYKMFCKDYWWCSDLMDIVFYYVFVSVCLGA